MLELVTAVISLFVSNDRAKERLRVVDSDSDAEFTSLIKAATAAVEKETGRILQPSKWKYFTDCWEIEIPAYPVRTILSVNYLDEDHIEQTIAPENYYWHSTSSGAVIHFITDYNFPTLSDRDRSINVVFEAGYDDVGSGSGDDPNLIIPPTVELCILFLVGHWYESREAGNENQNYEVPKTFEFLASQLRIYR